MADFIGLAFVAGLLAFFSPCSVALVPAYIGLFLPGKPAASGGASAEPGPDRALPRRFLAGLMGLVLASAALLVSLAYVAAPPEGGVRDSPWTAPLVGALASAVATSAAGAWVFREASVLGRATRAELARAGLRGAALGLVVSAGFITVFGATGLAISATQGAVVDVLPYIAMASAVALLVLGALMLAGRPISVTFRVFAPMKAGWMSSYVFGIGYAFVSTGCLLPVFLLVVSASLAAGAGGGLAGGLSSVTVMLAYAAGYSVLMVALSTYVSLTRNATLGAFRRLLPHIERVAGAVVIAAALYIIWYAYTSVIPNM